VKFEVTGTKKKKKGPYCSPEDRSNRKKKKEGGNSSINSELRNLRKRTALFGRKKKKNAAKSRGKLGKLRKIFGRGRKKKNATNEERKRDDSQGNLPLLAEERI